MADLRKTPPTGSGQARGASGRTRGERRKAKRAALVEARRQAERARRRRVLRWGAVGVGLYVLALVVAAALGADAVLRGIGVGVPMAAVLVVTVVMAVRAARQERGRSNGLSDVSDNSWTWSD
ncbi:hypothetical protein GCM10027047_38760 [Rhodococcus aerolatus]